MPGDSESPLGQSSPAQGTEKRRVPTKVPPKPQGKKMKDGYWQGNLKLFKPQGKGVYEYLNGDKYDGTMHEGKRQTEKSGNNRKAKMWWANGARYVGQFKDNCCHGEGKLWFPDGTTVSAPNWKRDMTTVTNLQFKNGDIYTGEISTWKLHGSGSLRWAQSILLPKCSFCIPLSILTTQSHLIIVTQPSAGAGAPTATDTRANLPTTSSTAPASTCAEVVTITRALFSTAALDRWGSVGRWVRGTAI